MSESATQFDQAAFGLDNAGDYYFAIVAEDTVTLRLRHSRSRAALINQRLYVLGVPATLYFDDASTEVLLEWHFTSDQAKQAKSILRRLRLTKVVLPS